MSYKRLLVIAGLVCSLAWGGHAEETTRLLLETHFELPAGVAPTPLSSGVIFLPLYSSNSGRSIVSREFMEAILKERMKRLAIGGTLARATFLSEFEQKASAKGLTDGYRPHVEFPTRDALAPKLLFLVESEEEDEGALYRLEISATLISYEKGKGSRLLPVTSWQKQLSLRNINNREAEEKVALFLRKELEAFARSEVYKKVSAAGKSAYRGSLASRYEKLPEPTPPVPTAAPAPPPLEPVNFYFGASGGTPTELINLNGGVWGWRTKPIFLGLSGLYLGRDRRGVQGDIGYILTPKGTLSHGLSMTLAGLHESHTEEIRNPDDSRETTRVDSIKMFVGGSYTLRWKMFHVQLGPVFRIEDGTGASTRLLIQVGITPLIEF